MGAKQESTFVLFGTGYDPSLIRLGDLVLHDYHNPLTVRHYTHTLDPRPDEIVSTPVQNICAIKSEGPAIGFSVETLSLVEAKVRFATKNQIVLRAESGHRNVLKDPDAFLKQHVLAEQEAVEALALWLSASRSEYMMKMKWLRKPRIWMLTGLYLLQRCKLLTSQSRSPAVNLGVSSALVGSLTSAPLGASVELNRDRMLEVAMEFPKRAVWAAQYQLLDTRYVLHTESDQTPFRSISLMPDITAVSRGSLRNLEEDTRVAVSVASPAAEVTYPESDDESAKYCNELNAAIVIFEEVLHGDDSD